jgi:glycosyltransferase involved in cell wall biosynthesis
MTRVAHVVTRCIAGAGGVAVRGAIGLDPARYEGVLVTGTSSGRLLDQAREHGIEVVVVPELRSPISPSDDLAAFRRLRRLFRQRRFDVVHTHSAKAGALGRVAAHSVGVPRVVHTIHGFPFHDFQGWAPHGAYVTLERRLARITDAFLAVGTNVAVEALQRGIAQPEQLHTIGPAVDPPTVWLSPQTRTRARALLDLPDDVFVIGTVGRLDYQKAPEHMLEAISRLARPAVLVWVGDGELAGAAASTARRLGIADRVRFLGHREDVQELLPAFDVFAMSSRYEGLPCAVVEAQQCGIPVVATAVNAVPDVVIPGETGLLVPPARPDLLARALDHALSHPAQARQWATAARLHLGSRYDPATLAEVLDAVYSTAGQVPRVLVGTGRGRAALSHPSNGPFGDEPAGTPASSTSNGPFGGEFGGEGVGAAAGSSHDLSVTGHGRHRGWVAAR